MHTSFISEHTAELILVPDILRILQPAYPVITPLYYWATREGGVMSRQSFELKQIRVLAFYPRRPKVKSPGTGTILVKFNELLYHRSSYFHSKGIPVIAGVPLADSLDALSLQTPCMWFELAPGGGDSFLEIHLATQQISDNAHRVLLPEDIISLIEQKSVVFTWPAALQIIKEMGRYHNNENRHWNRMSGDLYKPDYLLLHCD